MDSQGNVCSKKRNTHHHQEEEPVVKRQKTCSTDTENKKEQLLQSSDSEDINRTGAKCVPGGEQDTLEKGNIICH